MADDDKATREPGAVGGPAPEGGPPDDTASDAAPAVGAGDAPPASKADAPQQKPQEPPESESAIPTVGQPETPPSEQETTPQKQPDEDHDWKQRYGDLKGQYDKTAQTINRLREQGLIDDDGKPVQQRPAQPQPGWGQWGQPGTQQPQAPDPNAILTHAYDQYLEEYEAAYGKAATLRHAAELGLIPTGQQQPQEPAQPSFTQEQVASIAEAAARRAVEQAEKNAEHFDDAMTRLAGEYDGIFVGPKDNPQPFMDAPVKLPSGQVVKRRQWLETLYREHGLEPEVALYRYDQGTVLEALKAKARVEAAQEAEQERVADGGPSGLPGLAQIRGRPNSRLDADLERMGYETAEE